MKKILPILLILQILAQATAFAQQHGEFIDIRDGQKYRTVKIGNQIWMAENLNYASESSKCNDNNEENCQKYGRLYDWQTAMKACPKSWHLPSKEEWDGLPTKAKHLKAKEGWKKNSNGTDDFGFAALPGGEVVDDVVAGHLSYAAGDTGHWWSSSSNVNFGTLAYGKSMGYDNEYTYWSDYSKNSLFSVRCVKD